ncbi:MAG: DUF2807 domain-containing protein [Chloroflexi bacterium]|nr:DUF2807 domain-containing protein [Chloroflexota bacterium]MCH8338540.1 DUF2807 domain-containing protein [Chloroflexota bacterium]
MFKTKLEVLGLMLVVVLLTAACGGQNGPSVRGSGNLITESRAVGKFDRVDISPTGELIIIQSSRESLTIEADDNIMPFITSEVRGRTLYLDLEHGQVKTLSPTRIRYTLNVASLDTVSASGAPEISAESLNAERLDIAIGGAGKFSVNKLIANELIVELRGAAEMHLAGEVIRQVVDIEGSSKYLARDLRSETLNLTVGSVARATVWVTENLTTHVTGLANVSYYGNPQTNLSVSSGGEIKNLGGR